MIPKRIFYVWGKGEKKSTLANVCIESWRFVMPDFEIEEINEDCAWFDFNKEYERNLWFKTIYDLKLWAYVADYMRAHVIYDHGGIYFDTDVTAYKDFTPLLNNKMFIGNCPNNVPELATFGAQKGHPYLKDLIDFYDNEVFKSPEYIITQIFTKNIANKYGINPKLESIVESENLTIYPPEYMNPHHFSLEFNHKCITENTYSIHWASSSWVSKKNLYFLSNKHRVPIKTLLKQMDFIEKVDKKANEKVKI